MTDLFLKEKPKREQLLDYIRAKQWVKTSSVIRWGLDHGHTRAERDARDLAEEGFIRRMDKEKVKLRFGEIGEEVWEII